MLWPNGKINEPPFSDEYGPRTPIKTSAGWTRPYHVGGDWHSIGRLCAIAAGTVVDVSKVWWAGWQVLIDLGTVDGTQTWVRYCHLSEQSPLKVGQKINEGDFVGFEGATGQVTAKHLHMEIYRGRVDRGDGANPGSTIDPRAFIRARLTQPLGGLPMFALYWTGPTVNNTHVSGRMVTAHGSFWVPSMQIMNLLNRRHDAALKPGDNHDNMLDAEHDIINGFLQVSFRSAMTGVELDPVKLRSALTDALKAAGTNLKVTAEAEIPVEKLAAAFEKAAPRVAAAMVKQAGVVMSK